MKNKVKISLILFIIILSQTLTIYASGANVKFQEKDQDNILTIQVENSEKVGVIEGIIGHDSGIEQIQISSSYNGWTAVYNEETGKFNAFKAEGANSEETIQITYQLNPNSSQGTITVEDIELTTISYKTIDVENNISKTIKRADEATKGSSSSESSSKTSSVNGQTKENGQVSQNKEIPKLGGPSWWSIAIIAVVVIIAIILYKKVRDYKEIK